MSGVDLPDNAGRIDTFTRIEGEETVNMQAIVPVSPATGAPLDLATEATLATLVRADAERNQSAPDVLGSANPNDGTEPVTLVAMHPDYPLTLDPGQILPVGGRTKAGALLPQAADERGAQILSDAPQQFTGQAFSATGTASILCSFDTQGYQSISLQLFGTWVGTVAFFVSNDGKEWLPVWGYQSVTSVAMAATATINNLWILPAVGRYFKAQLTAYTSGLVLCSAYLRNQPMPIMLSTANQNIAQAGGYALVQPGGISAMPPFPIGGGDPTGRIRRMMFDVASNLNVVGGLPDPAANPVPMRPAQSNQSEDGMADVLNQILRELQYHSFVLQQLPLYLNSGLSLVDEVASVRDDPTLPLN